jgi:mRNA-degrading endonuclease RelE of RelBE toxin-antitoxin system
MKSFKQYIKEMAYPVSFSFEEFNNIKSYNGKLKYANERLQKISSGSARVVYKVDEEKVLKIAKNKKGIGQNSIESDWGLQRMSDIVAKIFDTNDDHFWVEMELAKKLTPNRFKQLTGMSVNEVQDILNVMYTLNNSSRRNYLKPEQLKELQDEFSQKVNDNEFLTSLTDMIINFGMKYPGDFGRVNSYGEVLREGVPTVVLVDFGLSESVWDDFYKVN